MPQLRPPLLPPTAAEVAAEVAQPLAATDTDGDGVTTPADTVTDANAHEEGGAALVVRLAAVRCDV